MMGFKMNKRKVKKIARKYLSNFLKEEGFLDYGKKYIGGGIGASLGAGAAGISWILNRRKYNEALKRCGDDIQCKEDIKKAMTRSSIYHLVGGALAAGAGGLLGHYGYNYIRNRFSNKNYGNDSVNKEMENKKFIEIEPKANEKENLIKIDYKTNEIEKNKIIERERKINEVKGYMRIGIKKFFLEKASFFKDINEKELELFFNIKMPEFENFLDMRIRDWAKRYKIELIDSYGEIFGFFGTADEMTNDLIRIAKKIANLLFISFLNIVNKKR